MPKFIPRGLGWCPDLPDPRDYTADHDQVVDMLATVQQASHAGRQRLPTTIDLRGNGEGELFPSAEDQASLNSSPVFAVLGVVEYFARRCTGRTLEGSRLFLYKMARQLLQRSGDTGIDLRTTLKALVRFGVPPERFWPYDPVNVDLKPQDPSLFGYVQDYAGILFFRLDEPNTKGDATLAKTKSLLAAGIPIVFGFCVPCSLNANADIPYRPTFDAVRGGQAVAAVGYDDRRLSSSRGALLIRSSWGDLWGEHGYGWLPYAYIEQQLAVDFWVILRRDWLTFRE